MAAQVRVYQDPDEVYQDLIEEFSAELCNDALEFVPASLKFCLE